MNARGGTDREPSVVDSYRTALALVQEGEYEQAAGILLNLLRNCAQSGQRTGDTLVTFLLDAARCLVLICQRYHAAAQWHRQAFTEADQREHESRQQLAALLGQLCPSRDQDAALEREPLPSLHSDAAPRLPPETMPLPVQEIGPSEQRKAMKPPVLAVYCLGPFRVYQDNQLIADWPSGKGKAIFKYMVANRGQPIAKDILMDLLWRDFPPGAARNNLNVALYGLRQALRATRPDFDHVLFGDGHYLLNPEIEIWVDAKEFARHHRAGKSLERRGQLVEAVREYEAAEGLYQGDFMEEDLYEDWPMSQREGFQDDYLGILDRLSRYYLAQERYATCIHLCHKILAIDRCREDAHRRLMRCYSRQGQRNLALHQYHLCIEILERVLEVPPMPETAQLYQRIRRAESA